MAEILLIFLIINYWLSRLHWSKKWLNGAQPWKWVPGSRPWPSTHHTLNTTWVGCIMQSRVPCGYSEFCHVLQWGCIG